MLRIPFCRRDCFSSFGSIALMLVMFVVFHCVLLKLEKGHQTPPPPPPPEESAITERNDLPTAPRSEFQPKKDVEMMSGDTVSGTSENNGNATTNHEMKKNSFKMRPKRRMGPKAKKSKENKNENKHKSFLEDQVIDLADEWTAEKMEAQAQVFAERAAALTASCDQQEDEEGALHPNMSRVHENIRWVTKHNLIWCPVYKAASTTWMSNLLLLAGVKVANMSLHKRVRGLYPPPEDLDEREDLLKNSFKMLIVRHPLERLLSAYRDKMLREDQFEAMSKTIRRRYPDQNAENETHPTFSQFLMYIRDCMKKFWKSGGKSRVNPHWQPVWWTCGPCQVKYDVIAHVETLTFDQEFIIRERGLTNLAFNAHTHSSNLDSFSGTTGDATRSYFSKIPKKLLKDVADLYRPDFELFGYSPEKYIQMGKD